MIIEDYKNEVEDLISIIVPVYNVYDYLDRCLKSIINQTYKNIQILLINDGSSDNSLQKCLEWQKKDERIIFISKLNEKVGPTRNLGIRYATGKYIMFVDSDDYVKENFVEKMYDKIVETDADIVFCDAYEIIKEKINPIFSTLQIETTTNFKEKPSLLYGLRPALWIKIYKRSLFINNQILMEPYAIEDFGVHPLLLYYAKKIAQIREPLYFYDKFRTGNNTGGDSQARAVIPIMKSTIEYCKKKEIFSGLEMYLKNFFIKQYLFAFYQNNKNMDLRPNIDKKLLEMTKTEIKKQFLEDSLENPEKILLIGSPELRNYIYFVNPYSAFFTEKYLDRFNFISIISLLSKKREIDKDSIQLETLYRQKMMKKNVCIQLKEYLKDKKYDKVIIDFKSELYDIVSLEEILYTCNEDFQKTKFFKKNKFAILKRSSKYIENVWKKSCLDFIQVLKRYFESDKVYIVENYNGITQQQQSLLKEYYTFFESNFDNIHIIDGKKYL